MTKDEALKLALEALERVNTVDDDCDILAPSLADAVVNAIDDIKEALAQPEQEPRNIRERWNIEFDGDDLLVCFNDHEKSEGCRYERYVPATTTPPQRTWVGLTEDDKVLIKHDANFNQFMTAGEYADRVQALTEARLKDKNT